MSVQSQSDRLQRELDHARKQVVILERMIALQCDFRDCPIFVRQQVGWEAPDKSYQLAVSFMYWGSGSFVIYGDDLEGIREAADFYAAQKYNSPEKQCERIEDQSHIDRIVLGPDGRRFQLVGIEPLFHSDFLNETHYVSDPVGCFSVSQVKGMRDWDRLGDSLG
jgi:hypothetical protein